MVKVYNTLTKKKEVLRPRKKGLVELFVCGITSYDYAHIGHARTYIAFDMIVKYLSQKDYDVFYLQNITDIDDKIIKRAKEKKTTPQKLARQFEKEYLKDMKILQVNSITKYARATDFIKEIINQIERLLKKGYAYQIEDGIYYDISKFKAYGKLSRRTVLQAEDAVSRIDESREKRNKGDFCLWKFSKSEKPKWKSPWSWGRPGWHIEDTAIAEKFFGKQYDIHGGARDLIFPHHEAEIAQMEAISGQSPMVKYWLHSGFLTVKSQKMAKSLGNFITINDFLEKHSPRPHTKRGQPALSEKDNEVSPRYGVGARILRFLVIKNHYRSPIDYNENSIIQAKKELERIDEFVNKINGLKTQNKDQKIKSLISKTRDEFEAAMEDDFNTPKAMAALFELITRGNSFMDENKFSRNDAKDVLQFLKAIDRIFNFIFWKKPKEKIPHEILNQVKEREKYRKQKNWQKADEQRKEIIKSGWWIEDTEEGPKLKKLENSK